ncbi:MAG TPA: ABC transporter ATP-binding protein [Herpetosiphonaceae bacterium]
MVVESPGFARSRVGSLRERWRDLIAAVRNLPRAFRLVWQAHRISTIGIALLTLIAAALPASQAWVGKLIVDAVVQALEAQQSVAAGLRTALPFLLLEFALITLSAVISQIRSLFDHVLHARVDHMVTSAIVNKAITLDLESFEDSTFYDKLQNARREGGSRALSSVNTAFRLIQNALTLLSFAVLLLAFSPLVALILVGATIPAFLAQARYSSLHFRLLTWRAPEFRRMQYVQNVLTVDTSAKEVKLFGLGLPLFKQYEDLFWQLYREDTALAVRRSWISLAWGLLSTASYYSAYAYIVWRTLSGSITLGDMTLYLTLCRQSQGTFQSTLGSISSLYESGLFLNNLFDFLMLDSRMVALPNGRKVPRPIRQGIEFRNVSFRYPGRDEWALRDVNLLIAPGEKLALVGNNGAGKTTLIKLLTRLYDPTEGQILLDGVDLREYDLDDLRLCIGVIFQDFVRYQATVRENIGYGQITALDDQDRLLGAAQRGGADEVVATLPDGYETMLGRWFKSGHELSGGQWQKIALGRAFMRDGAVLVLDEPTAALDAEREYAIFQRFRDLTNGKIALLISHRFSTVRMADRIAVLENGHLTELGTHADLLIQNGTYARLFNLQAEGYR